MDPTAARLRARCGWSGYRPLRGYAVDDAFKGIKGLTYKPDRNFTLAIPTPEPLSEPDDMVIVEPPCHPNEPIKVPAEATQRVHCLICGSPFTA